MCIFGFYSFIGGGSYNTLSSTYCSTITGGSNNSICANSSFIGGGDSNSISNIFSTIVGGQNNHITSFNSFIGGGLCNKIDANYSSISGGNNNCICSSSCASFVVGALNTVTGLYSAAIGCNISNGIACSTAVNQLWACNLVGSSVGLCVGTNGLIVRNTSDGTLKTKVCPITNGLSSVTQLNPVSFYWNEEESVTRGCEKQLGFIAQEVEPVIPEAVGKDSDGIYSLAPDKIIPVLTKAIQELSLEIENMKKLLEKNNII